MERKTRKSDKYFISPPPHALNWLVQGSQLYRYVPFNQDSLIGHSSFGSNFNQFRQIFGAVTICQMAIDKMTISKIVMAYAVAVLGWD